MDEQKISSSMGWNSYTIYYILVIVLIFFISYLLSIDLVLVTGAIFLVFIIKTFTMKNSAIKTVESEKVENKNISDTLSESKNILSSEINSLFEAGFSVITFKKVIFLIINTLTSLTLALVLMVLIWWLEISFYLHVKLPLPIFILFCMASFIIPLFAAGLLINKLLRKNFFDNRYILLKFIFLVIVWLIFYIFLISIFKVKHFI